MDIMQSIADREFPVTQQCHYLNHAAVAPWPESARKAVTDFASENTLSGASHYMEWLKVEESLRLNLAQLCGADVDEIAFVKNTSEALSFVAYGIAWNPGDVVVISDEEFPSNRIVWESLADKGVVVKEVSLTGDSPEEGLLAAIMDGARLLAVSAVQYASGTRLDLKLLGEACRATNTLFCVDAIQAIGATAFNVKDCLCDFAMADGHKWMLGAEGLGLFYIRRDVMDELSLQEFGWHSIETSGDYSNKEWQLATSARRFECGSPNLLGVHALKASTDLLLSIGMEEIEAAISERVCYLASALKNVGASILTPEHSLGRSGIITFDVGNHEPITIWQALMEEKVICMHRGGGIRFSPHFHTPFTALDAAVEKSAKLCEW